MRKINFDLLRTTDASTCPVTTVPSEIKHFNAGLGVLSMKTLQKGVVVGSYYATLVYQGLSSREHTRHMYGDRIQKMDVARFFQYELPFKCREDSLTGYRTTWKREAILVDLAPFWTCEFVQGFPYA